jgi:acyl-CoA dehydrogenase
MLNECLVVGRSITLPSTASGGAKPARGHRRLRAHPQAVRPVDRPLRRRGRSAGAHRRQGLCHQRAVAGHRRRGRARRRAGGAVGHRQVPLHRDGPRSGKDVMDVIGGKGIILGPRNFAGRAWQASPIAITVEGANIMTRSLLIFGQGAILCHPWVMKEMKAAQLNPTQAALEEFDRPVRPHRLRHLQRGALVLVRPHRLEDRQPRRATTTPAATSASSTATRRQPGADGGRVDAAAGRQAEVQGIAVRPPGRRAQPPVHRQRHAQAPPRRRAPEADQPLLAWAFHDSVHKIERRCRARCATSRSVRWAGCCGPGVPVGPPRRSAERPPGPPRRRAADDAERSARPPGPKACS